jgi:hypothetical protein
MKLVLTLLLLGSLTANILLLRQLSQTHIRPREGKDVGIEMKSMVDGTFDGVILVYGYDDNYPAAEEIVKYAEKTAGRPPGSFRARPY